MTESRDQIAEAILRAFLSQYPDEASVSDALYTIASSLDRIANALEGPWPSALAESFAREFVGVLER